MADEASTQASSSLPQGEESRILTSEDKAVKKKRYYSERDATKIYLFDQHARWRELMNELGLVTDKELAAVLLDDYMSRKNQHFRMRLQYSKKTKVWQPVNILEPKEYAYIPELLVCVLKKRVDVPGPVTQQLVRSADDPRNIAPNIAAIPRPTLQEALQRHQSRF